MLSPDGTLNPRNQPAVSGFCFNLVERLARIPERIDSRWNAAIDADLKQDFLDLVLGDAVLQRALDMQFQFMRPVEGTEHCQIDDAAGAPIDAWPGPQRAPAKFGRPF